MKHRHHPFVACLLLWLLALTGLTPAQLTSGTVTGGSANPTLSNVSPFTSTFDARGSMDVVNAQPHTAAHMAAWTGGGGGQAPPVSYMIFGDSHSTSFDLGPNMRLNGYVGQSIRNTSGTVTTTSGDFTKWINGRAFVFNTSSSAEFTVDGSATGDVRGDTAFVAYIAQSGGGGFDLEASANGSGTWAPFGVGTAKNFTADSSTDICTSTAHGFVTGTGLRLTNSGGALPTATGGNLAIDTTYIVIRIDNDTFKLARTPALATAGTVIDLTGNGTGTHTATPYGSLGFNTANASTVGVAATRALSATNFPAYRVRVTNVTTASVTVICAGIYYANGGGVIYFNVGNQTGMDVSQCITVPTAIFNPIWQAMAPKLVVSAWADGASTFAPGGAWRTWYSMANAAYTGGTDYILCSSNVTLDETGFAEQRVAQRQWALEADQTWINGRAIWPSWANALARNWVTDDLSDVHLSAYGNIMRNMHLFQTVPVFSWPLGRSGGTYRYGYGTTPFWEHFGNSNLDSLGVETRHNIATRGSSAGVTLGDRAQSVAQATEWQLYNDTNKTRLYGGGGDRVAFDTTMGMTLTNGLASTYQALTGAGAIALDKLTTKLTSTGASQAVTLANGTDGQLKTIIHAVDGGSMVLTPTTASGYTSITFTNAGESILIQYFTGIGWVIVSIRGAVAS